jgi:hypothetical protein
VYPSDIDGVKQLGSTDAVEGLLSAADAFNVSVHLGLELNAHGFSGPHSNLSASFFRTMGAKNVEIVGELHKKYGHHRSLVGMYDPHELSDVDWTAWAPPERKAHFVQLYLKPTFTAIHELGYVGSVAPFFCGSFNESAVAPYGSSVAYGWGPANISSFYSELLRSVQGIDILAVQDCRGVFSRLAPGYARWNATLPEMPFYRAFADVVAKFGRKLWSTTEIFWYPQGMNGTTHPAPMERIADQLVGEAEYCTKLTSFCWLDLSPTHSNESAALYKNYVRWLNGLELQKHST